MVLVRRLMRFGKGYLNIIQTAASVGAAACYSITNSNILSYKFFRLKSIQPTLLEECVWYVNEYHITNISYIEAVVYTLFLQNSEFVRYYFKTIMWIKIAVETIIHNKKQTVLISPD